MKFETLGNDLGYLEGPVHLPDGTIAFTAVDRGCLYRLRGEDVAVFASPGGGPNGAAVGEDGTIFIAQNGGRRPAPKQREISGGVQAIRPDGRVETITTDPVASNDLCFGPDGRLYVTDPTLPRARHDGRIWRVDPETGDAELLGSTNWFPNGIGFNRSGDLYVAAMDLQQILVVPIENDVLGTPHVLVQMEYGYPDGFAFDVDGNLIVAAVSIDSGAGQLQVYDPAGSLLDVIEPGNSAHYTNVALSPSGVLVVTDASGGQLLRADWPTKGLPLYTEQVAVRGSIPR